MVLLNEAFYLPSIHDLWNFKFAPDQLTTIGLQIVETGIRKNKSVSQLFRNLRAIPPQEQDPLYSLFTKPWYYQPLSKLFQQKEISPKTPMPGEIWLVKDYVPSSMASNQFFLRTNQTPVINYYKPLLVLITWESKWEFLHPLTGIAFTQIECAVLTEKNHDYGVSGGYYQFIHRNLGAYYMFSSSRINLPTYCLNSKITHCHFLEQIKEFKIIRLANEPPKALAKRDRYPYLEKQYKYLQDLESDFKIYRERNQLSLITKV